MNCFLNDVFLLEIVCSLTCTRFSFGDYWYYMMSSNISGVANRFLRDY